MSAENERTLEIMSVQILHHPVRRAQPGANHARRAEHALGAAIAQVDPRRFVGRNKTVGFNTHGAQYRRVRVNRAPTGLAIGAAAASGDG